MDIEQVATLVSTVGFPVVAAGSLLWWIMRSLNGKLDRLVKGLDKNNEAILKNTEAVNVMCTKLTGEVIVHDGD